MRLTSVYVIVCACGVVLESHEPVVRHACDSLNAPVEGPEGRYCHWPRRLRETRVDGWGKA